MTNNVLKILIQNSAERANNPAIIYNNQPVSYSQLYTRSIHVSKYLQKKKIHPQQPIGLLLKNGPEYLSAYYGCLLAGVLPVLLPNYLSTNKLTYNFNKIKIDTVIFNPEFQKTVDEIELKKGTPLLKIASSEIPIEEVRNTAVAADSFPDTDNLMEPAVITFTDGNSGFPKTVVHSQNSLFSNAQNCLKLIQGLHSVRLLSTLPVFHYISHSFIPHTTALSGGAVVFSESLNPDEVCQAITQNQVNVLIGTPDFYNRLIAIAKPGNLNSLKYCIVAGGNLSEDTFQALKKTLQVYITELYGLTETHMLAALHDESDRQEQRLGRPFLGIDIRITKPSGALTTPGTVGELQVRTSSIMLNYFDDLNEQRYNSGSWFRTGDLVRLADDDTLIFEGRTANSIIKYGYEINPSLIEKVVRRHPAIQDVVACPVKITNHDDQIKIYIIQKEPATLNNDEIMSYCQQNLPGYLWPDAIETVPYFERDLSGKILRNLLNKS